MKLRELKNKKILILGFGREGEDTLKFLKRKFLGQKIGIADSRKNISRKKGFDIHSGENYLQSIKDYDIIIKSPGISMETIKPFLSKGSIITSQTDIFLNNSKGKIVGITGTKGKSTTASIIFKMISSQGIKSFLIGNIGEPVLKHLLNNKSKTVYVYELSSFQLETTTKSPHIAVMLNLFKDHLDHHKDMDDYRKSKEKITKFQTVKDIFIFNSKDRAAMEMARKSKAIKIPFDPENDPLDIRKDITIPSEVLLIIAKIFKIPRKKVVDAVKKFQPLPHRLEYVGKFKGIDFYNDSAATIPEATISAINKIGESLNTIIIGGVDKGFNLKKLSLKIAKSPVRNLITFPETGRIIEKELSNKKNISIFRAESMKEAVSIAFKVTEKGKICLLAPAASSFNMFKSYKDRGDLFKKYVKKQKNRS